MNRKDLIVNPYFICGLLVLILNDCYLKYEYSNILTGKLSDFAGLLIFPLFLASVFPRIGKAVSLITGIGFVLWKLPITTPVIDLINQIPFVHIQRVIDYSDYMALLILPLSHYLINGHKTAITRSTDRLKIVFKMALMAVAFFAFCATSSTRPYEMPKGTIYIGTSYNIRIPKDSVINSIRKLGYNCDFYNDTTGISHRQHYFTSIREYYQTDHIQRDYDTIANVKYTLSETSANKTKLTIINVTLPQEGNIQSWKRLRGLSKHYKRMLKSDFVKKID